MCKYKLYFLKKWTYEKLNWARHVTCHVGEKNCYVNWTDYWTLIGQINWTLFIKHTQKLPHTDIKWTMPLAWTSTARKQHCQKTMGIFFSLISPWPETEKGLGSWRRREGTLSVCSKKEMVHGMYVLCDSECIRLHDVNVTSLSYTP